MTSIASRTSASGSDGTGGTRRPKIVTLSYKSTRGVGDMSTRAPVVRRLGEPPAERAVGVTVHEAGDARLGPTVVVLGGVHGDEGQGVRGCLALLDTVAGIDLRGRLLVVPVAHEAAVAATLRTSPIDGLDLARCFPGDASGRPTERLAHLLETEVLMAGDLVIDLHSSGVHHEMATLVGWCDDGSPAGREAARVAEAMGMPVTWRHPGPPPPGRSGSGAHARGRPFVYLESTEADELGDLYRDACLRALVQVRVIDASHAPPRSAARLRLAGPGDLDDGAVRAEVPGLLEREVGLLDRVSEGQRIAWLREAQGGLRREVVASREGHIVMVRRSRLVGRGGLIAFITGVESATAGRGA
jgi:predicted deacylase